MTIELTDEEQGLLNRYLDFYDALACGDRTPDTEAQEHFVKVTQGKAGAETMHELAYAKHMRRRALEREMSRLEFEKRRESEEPPEWFSREDYWKSRGRQYSDFLKRRNEV